ncbi:MAG TPA: hypothetical protein VFO12_11815 [Sphingomicrobium sp.]|nr:hypothetical protein [Sphingomicrobium sp.]
MANDRPESISDADLEHEIRRRRKFTTEEAIGRLAGPGAMKGASAVSPQQQAENAVGVWLRASVMDPSGSLRTVLHRHLKCSKLLLEKVDDPLGAAAACLRQLLASEHGLREIVREADFEWGRAMDERPRFEREGSPPDADDPYTVESVRKTLVEALQQLPS